MLEIYQQTISKPISFEGIGLHTGKKSKINIFPGQADQGIVFKRIDLKKIMKLTQGTTKFLLLSFVLH